MKAFAVLLLCAFAAVQGRSAGGQSTRVAAALGDNPYVVHLRFAVSTSGLLSTCVGSLIDQRWVLTSASCLADARFVWVRYGAVQVISPSLVTETSTVRIHPEYNPETGENNIALLSVNRNVEPTENINWIGLSTSDEVSSSGTFCGYGESDGQPGEYLSCFGVSLTSSGGSIAASSDNGEVSVFDVGAPVVSDGQQVGIVVGATDGGSAPVLAVSDYIEWIESTAEITL